MAREGILSIEAACHTFMDVSQLGWVGQVHWMDEPFYISVHYIISKSDILKINCSSIAPLDKCISQDTEPLQGAYDKI